MSKARVLADFISDGSTFADGAIDVAEVSGAAPLASPTFTGTASGTFSGPLTGNVTGNVTGDVTGDVTGNITGNVTGNVTGDVAGEVDLSALAATIADTAVDIFVYDTRKDSDGGAWRKRTQHTSWYNETLNTATRGSRKEFPAVAVITSDQANDKVTIYDGDDPDLPMWMVFNAIDGMMVGWRNPGSIYALNGVLAVGGSEYDLWLPDFIKDTALRHTGTSLNIYNSNIAGRNNANTNYSGYGTGGIVDRTVNDVAMTVLPNAPIDAATGLPVPTIAVATDGGWSQISDDGNVYDFAFSTNPKVTRIGFRESNGTTLVTWNGDSNLFIYDRGYFEIPLLTSDKTGQTVGGFTGSASFSYGTNTTSYHPMPIGNETDGTNYSIPNVRAGINGLSLYDGLYENRVTGQTSSGMVAYVASDYATGWQNGAIKLATLSDTDATNVTGSELVTNGTFDTDLTGWSYDSSYYRWKTGGYLERYNLGTQASFTQTITTVAGKTYVLSFDVLVASLAPVLGIGGVTVDSDLDVGTYGFTFTATSTSTIISFTTAASTLELDNVSVRLAEEDRSVNGNGLQVFGTLTKSAVATGADLVAYSGFSTSNFLAQPPNSDFDIGTGTICVMTWVKYAGSGNQNIVTFWDTPDYGTFTSASYGHYFQLTSPADGKFNFAIGQASPSSATALTTTTTYNDSQWHMVVGVRDNGVMKIYVDGQLQLSGSNTLDIDTSGTGFLIFGKFYGTIGGWGGDIALTRISTTAPSPEQIRKMYNDEKVLFQEGAQATLYGSSDAVTALAYDDSTNLLHVGTSAGRSVFQGLRRVDNTTTAVGAAISASNSMVAED